MDCPLSVTAFYSPTPILCIADSQVGVTAPSRPFPHHPTTPASCLTSCKCLSLPQVYVETTQVILLSYLCPRETTSSLQNSRSLSPTTSHRSMLPVPPNVAPTISLELDVDDGEVENYEVRQTADSPHDTTKSSLIVCISPSAFSSYRCKKLFAL